MAFRTGRTRTLSWSGKITGSFARDINNQLPPHPPFIPLQEKYAILDCTCSLVSINVKVYFAIIGRPTDVGSPYSVKYGVQITVQGYNQTNVSYEYNTFNIPADGIGHLTYDLDIDWAVSIPVREVFIIEDINVGSTNPWWNRVPDAPTSQRIKFYLETTGGPFSVSAGSASIAGYSFNGEEAPMTNNLSVYGYAAQGSSGTFTVSRLTGPCPYTGPSYSETKTNPDPNNPCTATATISSSSAALSLTSLAGDDLSGAEGIAQAIMYGDREYSVSGAVRAMEQPYPNPIAVGIFGHVGTNPVTATKGVFNTSGTQLSYNYNAHLLQFPCDPPSLQQQGYFGCVFLDEVEQGANSLPANGEDPLINRCMFRGRLMPGLTLSQAAATIIDSCNSVGSSDNGWSTSLVGGGVTVNDGAIVAPNGGDLLRRYKPQVSCLSCRYLRIRLRVVGADNVEVSITIRPPIQGDLSQYNTELGGGSVEREDVSEQPDDQDKQWTVNTGLDGVWADYDIDLCAPQNIEDLSDDQDTRWPFPYRFARYFGVWRIRELAFSGLPETAHIEVDSISLIVADANSVRWDCLPTFYPCQGQALSTQFILHSEWPQYGRPTETLDSGTVIEYYTRRFILGRVDGRQTVEEADFSYTKLSPPDASTVWTFSIGSITGMAGSLTGSATTADGPIKTYPGLDAVINAPESDGSINEIGGYLNRNQPAVWLAGGGAWYHPSNGWQFGFDLSGAIPAQPLFDQVESYPDCGDVFGHAGGSTTGPIILRAAAILRSSAHGLALEDSVRTPLPNDLVEHRVGTTSMGSGVTNDKGYFQTASGAMVPVIEFSTNSVIQRVNSPSRSVTVSPTLARHRHRMAYLAPPSSPCFCCDSTMLVAQSILLLPDTKPDTKIDEAILPFASWRLVRRAGNIDE